MRFYNLGNPKGRYIGRIGEYDLYPSILAPTSKSIPTEIGHHSLGDFNFSYGPSAGGLLESVRFLLMTPGEIIENVSVRTDYKLRTIELSGKKIEDALLLVERINGFHSASHSIAFLLAVEDALGITPDYKIQASRIIQIELERIRSHLHVLSRMTEPAAFGVPLNYLNYLKEKVSRLIGKHTGHRFFFGVNGLNYVAADFGGLYDSLVPIVVELKYLRESLLSSKIFIDRLQGNGKIKDETFTGPVARASGYTFDARVDSQSLPYSDIGFHVITTSDGDAYGRFMQRIDEVEQSLELIEKIELSSKADLKFKVDRQDMEGKTGTGIARIESPSGDLTYLVEVDDNTIKKVNILTPSEINFPVFSKSMNGGVFTDFHFNWESFGIWISELGVRII